MMQLRLMPAIWQRSFLGISMIVLTACSKTLETSQLEADMRERIIRQGGISLKTVTCPKNVKLEVGKTFDCIGELDSGNTLAIPVKQVNEQGKTSWELTNTKGLLNLSQLETLFQQTLKQEGKNLVVDCGTGYRSVQPGDRFECKVIAPKSTITAPTASNKGTSDSVKANPTKKPESIAVIIDPQGNVNWQQVFPAPAKIAIASASTNSTSDAADSANSDPVQAAENRKNLSPETLKDLEQRSD